MDLSLQLLDYVVSSIMKKVHFWLVFFKNVSGWYIRQVKMHILKVLHSIFIYWMQHIVANGCNILMWTYPTVPLQGFHQGTICVRVKDQALVHVLEVQVFECGWGLGTLFAWGAAFVRGSLQVVLVVHLHGSRQHIVHDHHSNGDASTLDAVEAVELGQ